MAGPEVHLDLGRYARGNHLWGHKALDWFSKKLTQRGGHVRTSKADLLSVLGNSIPTYDVLDYGGEYKGFFSTGNASTWLWPSHGVVLGHTAYFNTPLMTQSSPGASSISIDT